MHHKTMVLVAPSLHNMSCSHPRFDPDVWRSMDFSGSLQATIVLILTVGVLAANMMLILIINSRKYSKYIHSQPRYLLTSLASNDLAMGFFVTPFAIIPSFRRCWPYGELLCQIQALLRGAISQQSAVILICMAMDRYMCMLHPARYHKHSSKKFHFQGCVAIISLTWILSVTLFAALALPKGGYYFNPTGMMACEPFYSHASVRILAACGFYFPTTMILMYCYGSAFHVNKLRLRKAGCNVIADPERITVTEDIAESKVLTHERRLSASASRTMAAISLGFIVLVTPWTIQEVVAACTGSRAPQPLDFFATWLALSNSFWNPFLYWLLNNQFRRVGREFISNKFFCKKSPSKPQHFVSNSSSCQIHHQQGCDFERLSEKYWGEILERTLSATSLNALQKSGSHPRMDGCNGMQRGGGCGGMHRETRDISLPDL
ncbi:trace amine-associated receptor 8c isoform X1 [Onthophagus taurus]|uniref:trace amine-associated receptor 8c isoform X1 n=1 Tax=Onthophagus taurus TaxID=166361 RepID=UPI0039BE8F56